MNIDTVVKHVIDSFRQRRYKTTLATLETKEGKIFEIKKGKRGYEFNLPAEPPTQMTLKKMKQYFSEMNIVRGSVTQKANFR